MSTNRLGKGLGALLGAEVEVGSQDNRFITVPIQKMKPNPKQARKTFNDEEIEELANSITVHGVIQPVLLNEDGKGGYIIIAGERRYRAAKKAGLKELPAIVKKLDESELMEVSLIENLQRVNLNPVEEAKGIKDLMDKCALTQEQAADRLGKSRPSVANSLRLLNLPPTILNMVLDDKISKGHAKCLLGAKDTEAMEYFAKEIVEGDMSVRALEQFMVKTADKTPKPAPKLKVKPADIIDIEERLSGYFATKVEIAGNENKGNLKIEYYSKDELNEILSKLTRE